MQIDQDGVPGAKRGQSVGIRVKEKVRERDLVYRVVP